MKKLIVIIGPTCTKKNSLAKLLAKEFFSHIVNADPFQTYQELNIGVNKPKPEELKLFNYHFINNNSIFDPWDVSIFQKQFYELCKAINQDYLIVCGGSHLYIDAIISGYNFIDENLDEIINQLDQNYTNEQLYNFILEHDIEYANKISINNRRRLLRSVAIMKQSNKTMTMIANNNKSQFECLIIRCIKPREQLYADINRRVDLMLSLGWIDEVRNLYKKYKDQLINLKAFKAIGYSEILNHIISNQPLDIELIKQKVRRLAKMQLTWCNNKFTNSISYCHNIDDTDEIVKQVRRFLYES